ncbi:MULTISPECIES: ribonucleoside-diphosphate reductase subunit alpha [Acinetobacter]|jgi:ribonucleoside-diphosphate reductase alpha chain|uniref:ribonucleoside-diphosphate reductase subunit alpha n=1 Tax=Acinetobacter TaxID=469 RepID=UPI000450FFDD|nr:MULTISPECIES: ribonucleoside-diphosphate reductase subunit alpha [Acinetobacter]MDQ9823191.1 ribonucleoside-diphosphate reductase subunit alpha [Acinetobacter sp. 163]EHU1211189.1 ribonucleoside-diphosphate reductase subunit alpha [Acinetobacter nosocomialis]EXH12935.1 ribonucleoside-diphosphate reductase, alpha subunit [Acinetobacter sp. 1245593]MBM9557689.1 ribonucleoside-diphosphate reductase subunit alpha [Acinetobacter nosocomialis]MBP1509192.1 ribonucleoside-diphosphate reductase subu
MSVITSTPGQIQVIKRTGDVAAFDAEKISVAIGKAFLAVEGQQSSDSSRIHDRITQLTEMVLNTFKRRLPSGGTIHIEEIQDQVELALMRTGEQKVARAYVIYREQRASARQQTNSHHHPTLQVTDANGQLQPLDLSALKATVNRAAEGLEGIEVEAIIDETVKNLYNGVKESDIATTMMMATRTRIEQEPNYTYVTARLLRDELVSTGLAFLGLPADTAENNALEAFLNKGVELDLLSPDLLKFDLEKLAAAIQPERSNQFTYLGLQTLFDRYFIHSNGVRFELPQLFFMRVSMGLALNEQDKEERAIEFYNLLSSFDYMASTPTLFNSGTLRPQLSSCYLTTIGDDLYDIYGAMRDNAMLSKWAGGLGNDWTPVRALNSYIKGTNGKSQGVVPFLKVANDTAVAVNQGGKRKGAVCAYLETWHLDIEEFLELRKNTGDDRRRTHDMNTANWVPDLFMQRVFEDDEWTLFTPSETPDLHDLTGAEFAERYAYYESVAKEQNMLHKKVRAKDLWRKMLSMLFETGHPWITFKDVCNLRSPQQHVGVVHSSNLCTEITLNTNQDEIAVCNLGSINLVQHVKGGVLDREKLARTVKTAVRMLDNVIDINYYAVPQAKNSNLKHRPVGMGIMGFQDALYEMGMAYGSDEAVNFADESMEVISYYAIQTSSDLAVERGAYSTFKGSLWDQGILPIDSLEIVAKSRPERMFEVDRTQRLDWDTLRAKVQKDGMRNSNVMAIAPTATISNICGVSQSIEPTFQNLYVKSNLSGEFTVINPYLVRALKDRGLWDTVMVNDLKHFEGSVQKIARIPEELKAIFATAFEVEPRWIVDAASRRQKWIDQAQSLNLYISGANGKKLDITYKMAWLRGLKTTYYLRALGATSAEKSTINTGALNAVKPATVEAAAPAAAPVVEAKKPEAVEEDGFTQAAPVPMACSIDNPDCEACQ